MLSYTRFADPLVVAIAGITLALQVTTPDRVIANPPVPPVTDLDILRDLRTIHDVATLPLTDYCSTWSVARVTPGPNSGSGTVPGAYIEAETGRFVNPSNAPASVISTGTWLTLAGSHAGEAGRYELTQPVQLHQRMPDADDYYSALQHGGTILYRESPTRDARLIFPDWVDVVGPAIAVACHERAAPDPGWNRLWAVQAFREALATGTLGPSEVAAELAATDDTSAAVLAYLVLAHGDPAMTDVLASSPKLRSVVLGAAAASLFGSSSTAMTVLDVARHRLSVDRDPYVTWIFATFR